MCLSMSVYLTVYISVRLSVGLSVPLTCVFGCHLARLPLGEGVQGETLEVETRGQCV